MLFNVQWEIDIEAKDAREAAEKALAIQRDPDSRATVFSVGSEMEAYVTVDLDEEEEK